MNDLTLMSTGMREPQQERSKASYERMLVAAEKLMVKTGTDEFTLVQVAKVGKVSIGSIYLRFDGKEELVRAVHARILARVDAEQRAWLVEIAGSCSSLVEFVDRYVERFAESLRRNAPVLRPMMLRATTDMTMSAVGKNVLLRFADTVKREMLRFVDEFGPGDPERKITSAHRVIYSTIARYLGFASAREVAGEGDWEELKDDLAVMCTAFLKAATA